MESHPWDNFLKARSKAIFFFREIGYNDKKIAETLSMDEEQVYSIRTHPLNIKEYVEQYATQERI